MRFRPKGSPLQIAVFIIVAIAVIGFTFFQNGSGSVSAEAPQKAGVYTVADLPPEARNTLALIDRGGPYPFRQDDSVFGNRERLLPARASGYYREFTVVTPGSDDRGARRLIRGQKGETYCTSDHYASFHLVERN